MRVRNLLRLYSFLAVLTVQAGAALAQVPTYITAGGTANNIFPFASATSNKVQWVYTPTEFTPTIPGGLITHLYFRSNNAGGTSVTFNDLRISIGHVSFSTFTSGTYETGLTQCYLQTTTTISVPSNGWFGVQLDVPFTYNGTSNLVVEATVTNVTTVQLAQDGTNGNKRIWGGRTATTGSFGSGQAPCGLEIITCSTAITRHPVPSVTVCENQQTGFKAGAIDVDNYKWQVDEGSGFVDITNNINYSGATTDSLTISNIPVGFDGNKYRCLALKSSCVDSTTTATLNVNGLIYIDPMADKDTTCIGSTKELEAKFTGSVVGYKWQIYIAGSGYVDVPQTAPYLHLGNRLVITGVPDTLDGSIFRCVIDGVCNSVASTSTSLKVNIVPVVAVPPQDVLAEHGQTVSFKVQASGAGATYLWQVSATDPDTFVYVNNNGIYDGQKTNRLVVKSVSRVQDNFKFRCIVGTNAGCIVPGDTSAFALLNVNPPASVTTVSGDEGMLLYPNPAGNTELNIRIGKTMQGRSVRYKLLDKTGRTLLVGNISSNAMTPVDVGGLPPDVYVVQVMDNGNRVVAQSRFTKL